MKRNNNCLKKLERMNKTLHHQESDQVPISDFFWSAFIKRWQEELNLSSDTNPYKYYDLDWQVTIPNMDPHIKQFEVIEENNEQVIVRTGFEAILKKKFKDPMPEFIDFETNTIDKLLNFEFDNPWDDRRYFKAGDNQIGGVGDCYARNLPPWIVTVKTIYSDFPVYGSICEVNEYLTRLIGNYHAMLWIGMYPDEMAKCIKKIREFAIEITKAQIKAADGLLDGMVIWGDVAYKKGMFFSPDYWRMHFKPCVKEIIDLCHENHLPVIYHGCGNVKAILKDFIEMDLEAYNPLEAKAGLDVVELRKKYGHSLCFCGNMDVIEWASADEDQLKRIVLRKLNAAKGGGYIFQSDHSIPNTISGEKYDYVVKLVRKYGKYPLNLDQYDIPELR